MVAKRIMTEHEFVQNHKEALADTLNRGGLDGGLNSAVSRAWSIAEDADVNTEMWTRKNLIQSVMLLRSDDDCRRRIIGYKAKKTKIVTVVRDNATSKLCRVSEHAFRIHTRFRLADESKTHRKYLGELFGWVPETTYICAICGHEKDRSNGCYLSNVCSSCWSTEGVSSPKFHLEYLSHQDR